MTLFNIWHYVFLSINIFILVGGIVAAIKQPIKKLKVPMIASVILISTLITGISMIVVDKYTKKVSLHKLDNKRLLNLEKIAYFGMVRNDGKYPIGKVTIEIKLVNKGHNTGNVKAGSFFSPSGFLNFFSGGANILYKPQTIIKKFVVARNLKPKETRPFRVYFDYPPYFKNTSQFAEVVGH